MSIHLRRARRRRPRAGISTALCLRRALLGLLLDYMRLLEQHESWRLHLKSGKSPDGTSIPPAIYRAQEALRQTEYLEPR